MKADAVRSKVHGTNLAPKDDLKSLPLPEVEKKLDSSPDGLSQSEAAKRLTQYGPNEIAEKKTNAVLKFLSYFWGPIPWMIEVAVILSGIVRHWPDFGIILLLLAANATIGFWEERQAGNAIDALKARLAIKARVKRDGKWVTPAARELVPGDAIRLRLGDIVPADARLLDGDEVSVDQSALTGESLAATRKPGDAVFSGSIIRRGETDALVYATGGDTYFGRTAQLVETAVTVSHFQRAVLKIGNYLIVLAVALVAVIIGVALYRGDQILTTLQFALVLTVAAIPVAMPTVLSVTMAVGARLLAKKQAIVSKLVAIEELAGVDVLCADKTGTLTQNKLSLGEPFCLDKTTADELILAGALASRAENDDTIDLAVLGGLKDKQALKPYQVTHFMPFDPVHKRTEATVKSADGTTFKVTKGAPQVILALAGKDASIKTAVDKAVNDFAARGFRALGVARVDGDGTWRLLGVLPLFDPPREDAKSTVATAARMGVKIKMVTGDALAIARETAKTLGMGTNILDGATLGDSGTEATAAVARSIEDADGFAQVFPEHKFHIVDVLQKHGHIVGMTGDGVNDAPALKKADCGIAVSGATDAARAAASIVLMTPGLSVIIDAIKESRRIFQRMNSYAIYRIAETLRVLFFMTLSILVFNFYPLTAVMIVMLALLNDGAILSIAYDNVHYRDAPEAWNMRLVLSVATVLGVFGVVAAFGLFYLAERVFHIDRAHIQTLMYLKLSVAGHLTIFLTRTRGPFWTIRPAPILLIAVLGTQAIATCVAIFGLGLVTPLGWYWAALVWGYAICWALVNDCAKLLTYRVLDAVRAKPRAAQIAEAEAQTGVKAIATHGDETKTQPEPEARSMPKTEPRSASAPETKAAVEALVNTTLGDLLLAGSLKHPEDAGHIIAEAIAAAKDPGESAPHPQPTGDTPAKHNAGARTLANTTLGDLLLDGMLKQPENAGHIIAEAITAATSVMKDTASEPEPHPRPVAEIDTASKAAPKPEANPESSAAADPGPTGEPAAETAADAKPEPGPANLETLENTTLGALLLAGVLKHPEEAAHIIARAITDAEAPAPEGANVNPRTP
jgi:H+-transporting ATPase